MKKLAFLLVVLTIGIFSLAIATGETGAQKTDAKIIRVDKPIPNRYIIVFEDWATDGRGNFAQTEVLAQSLSDSYNGKISHIFETALNGFAAEFSEKQIELLAQDPRIKYIEEDSEVYATATQTNATWGLDRIDQRDRPLNSTYNYTATGTGVNVYIIDTGIRRTHNEYGGRAFVGYDAIGDGQNTNDCNGHGTHVAGTVGGATYGVAKNVRLYAVRVLNCSGSGTTSGVIAGVNWVANNRTLPAVANMSLGGGASTSLDNAVQNAISRGVTFAVAAGNENQNACNVSPARAANAITVGSTTSSDARSSFSNYGSCVDIFAPGSSITSAWHTSNTATSTISGTSMASPHVAGVAALYLESNPSASPATVTNAIKNSGTTGRLSGIGSGSPNLLLYSLLGGGSTPPPPPPPPPGCSGTSYNGALSGTGSTYYTPYYNSGSGRHTGNLTGPSGTDFDLYLQRWNGLYWVNVASGTSTSSTESVSYNGSSGYYRWLVYSYRGSGSFSLCTTRP
jgi:subtilisin family serine protease